MLAETQIDPATPEEPCPPKAVSELEALLHAGWKRHECGGQGDCGYLVVSQGLHLNQHGQFLDAETAQRNASNLRASVFQHIRKPQHLPRYSQFFASDPASGEKFDSFEAWIQATSKKGAWIDGMQIQAICEKTGTVLILWSCDVQKDGTEVWQRYTHAPRFSKGVACQAKGCQPIAVTLQSGHYQLLIPPTGTKFPERWLRETDIPPSQKLAGAGTNTTGSTNPRNKKADFEAKPTPLAESVPSTPSVHTCFFSPDGSHSKKASSKNVPIKVSQQAKSFQPDTPSVHTVTFSPERSPSESATGSKAKKKRSHLRGSVYRSVQTTRSKRSHAESNLPLHGSRLDLPEENWSVDTDSNDVSTHEHARSQDAVACFSAQKVVSERIKSGAICPWWQCEKCGFQVFRHANLSLRRPQMSRNKHLLKIHGIRASGIQTPPGEPSHRHAVQSDKTVKVANALFDIVETKRWVGLHNVTYVLAGHQRPSSKGRQYQWKCADCGKVIPRNQIPLSTCSESLEKGKPAPKTDSAKLKQWNKWLQKAEKMVEDQTQSYIKEWAECQALQNQVRRRSTDLTSKPKPFGGLPLVPKESQNTPKLWWACQFCDFSISDHDGSGTKRSYLRSSHLKNHHGIAKSPLPRDVMSAPQRLISSHATVQKRWQEQLNIFKSHRWPGAHDLNPNPISIFASKDSRGMSTHVNKYECKKCHRIFGASAVPGTICRGDFTKGKIPSRVKRAEIWAKCRKQAALKVVKYPTKKVKKQTKQTAKASKTLRKITKARIDMNEFGEASNPGPSPTQNTESTEALDGKMHLRMWSQNIRSFHTNGEDLLDRAVDHNVSLIAMQEINIGEQALPSVINLAKRKGWQMAAIPACQGSSNQGGVAVLCREPLALMEVSGQNSHKGQVLEVQIVGVQRNFSVICHYRHAQDTEFEGIHSIAESIAFSGQADWIIAMDCNANNRHGQVPDILHRINGSCREVAGHKTSTTGIDAIWSSRTITAHKSRSNFPGDGDHGIIQVDFDMKIDKPCGHQWRFSHVAKPIETVPQDEQVSWQTVAVSSQVWAAKLHNVSAAWHTWTEDIEKWLTLNHHLNPRPPERKWGSMPTLKTSTHHMAPQQNASERRLRRWVRRLAEAKVVAANGRPLPSQLQNKLRHSWAPEAEKQAVKQQAWGLGHKLAKERLQKMQEQTRKTKLQDWAAKVSTHSGACRWVSQQAVGPLVVKTQDGTILTARTKVVEALRDCWATIFGLPGQETLWEDFAEAYQEVFPSPQTPPSLPKITCADIKRTAMRMTDKATGVDGVAAKQVAALPQDALIRLSQFLHSCERKGQWPPELMQWKVVFLPKGKLSGHVHDITKCRPISIAPIVYRIWSAIRVNHTRQFLSQFLLHNQAGFQGPGVNDLLLSIDYEYSPETWQFGAALDWAKAFDSTDWHLCTRLLRHIGLCPRIVTLLEFQWANHTKWITAEGTVCPRPVRNSLGLLQGDAFSPVCMSLFLSIACRDVSAKVEDSAHFLCVDDRTILSRSFEGLMNALVQWDKLSQLCRLKNNSDKLQFWARTPVASSVFYDHQITAKSTVQTLGVSMGGVPRKPTEEEERRSEAVALKARRIATLPGSQRLKVGVASSVLSNKMVWGVIFNGRCPTDSESKAFQQLWRGAVQGFDNMGGHDCRHLTAIFKMGHTSDSFFWHVSVTWMPCTNGSSLDHRVSNSLPLLLSSRWNERLVR